MILLASVLVTLATATSASAKGKTATAPGKNRPSPPPSSTVSSPATAGIATATPFAWLDDASVMARGNVWLGVSMVHWRGSGLSQSIVPVIDGAVGLAPRLQLGASVPRVAGGLGTTFVSAKIGVLSERSSGLSVAVAPTLQILGEMEVSPPQRRAQWGLPVSVQVDYANARLYGSSGYFSPGIWYAGVGASRSLTARAGLSFSFSRAWTVGSSLESMVQRPRRNEVSGGASFDLNRNTALFGSLGQTLGTSEESGGGTTLSFGMSVSAAPARFTK
jgi:hypothetical protein